MLQHLRGARLVAAGRAWTTALGGACGRAASALCSAPSGVRGAAARADAQPAKGGGGGGNGEPSAEALIDWLVKEYAGEDDATALTPAQWAFAQRIGLQLIPPPTLLDALYHPAVPRALGRTTQQAAAGAVAVAGDGDAAERHLGLARDGGRLLAAFVGEYVRARLPRLPPSSAQLALQAYCNERSLAALCKSLGIDFALLPFVGTPRISLPALHAVLVPAGAAVAPPAGEYAVDAFTDGALSRGSTDSNDRNRTSAVRSRLLPPSKNDRTNAIYASIFKALLGAAFRDGAGARHVRLLLDRHVFSAALPVDLLVRPHDPMAALARALRIRDERTAPLGVEYRLLHESGRLSNDSIYVVGVYVRRRAPDGTDAAAEKLAEASGPSLFVAKERAAMEALKRMLLREVPNAPRASDALLADPSPLPHLRTIDDVEAFLRPARNQ